MEKVNYLKDGYQRKYNISKVDGSEIDSEANYFVLRLDKDPHALVGLSSYANSVEKDNPELANDLRRMILSVKKGMKTSEIVDKSNGGLFPEKVEVLTENQKLIKIGGAAIIFETVKSSNVDSIGFFQSPEASEKDIIFVLYHNKKIYAFQGGLNQRIHYDAMIEPATSAGSYCHRLTKEFGFKSICVSDDIIEYDIAKKAYPMVFDFDSYQYHASKTAIYGESIRKAFPGLSDKVYKIMEMSYAGLGLGEAGEVQGKLKKIIRDFGGVITEEVKNAVAKELGDELWYINEVCTVFNLSLQSVAQGNIDKLFDRLERGVIGGNGDGR